MRVSDKKIQVDICDKQGSFYRNETSPKGQSHLETTPEQRESILRTIVLLNSDIFRSRKDLLKARSEPREELSGRACVVACMRFCVAGCSQP